MKQDPKKLLEQALRLEPATRAFVAEVLLESLDFEEDFALSQEWLDEVRRRCEDIDRGKTELLDSETVIAELRGKYP